MRLPPDHPQRRELHDEVHARPPVALLAPVRLSTIALVDEPADVARQYDHLCALLARFGQPVPQPGASHLATDLGPFRMKWERHTEFTRYIFTAGGVDGDPFARPALELVPQDWLAALPGRVIFAAHGAMLPAAEMPAETAQIAARYFGGDPLVGAEISGGHALAFTDFRIDARGYSRLVVYDRALSLNQAGRSVQRLFEIEIYRMAALLALPVARELAPHLAHMERELAAITAELVDADAAQGQALLHRLTGLAAAIESHQAATHFRFAAGHAYHDLVLRRIVELRETRIEGLQTFGEFIERRLAPAMATCRSTSARLEALSLRVTRATQLLSTQVEVVREQQNQIILTSLNRRAELQFLLQQAVEGLSVAAGTYYVTGLIAEGARGLHAAGLPLNPELVAGAALPVVFLGLLIAVSRFRRRLHDDRG